MRNLFLLIISIVLLQINLSGQIITEQSNEPIFFKVKSHDSNIKELPEQSFYESRTDWQYIIDTTWGPGLPLEVKQEIFNAYVSKLEEKFDGFESLGFTPTTWNTFKLHYYSKIDSTTSRGRFSAIMYYFAMNLYDGHTYAYDDEVVHTPLNPGTPLLVFGSFFSIKHFGAVTTVLEDSTALVLRVVDNHPLNLEPGDIILGYEGEMWRDIVQELIEAELPAFGGRQEWQFGGTTGSQSSRNNAIHISVGMNWHLFNTIDILKYSTGDTLHLSVNPLLNLNIPDMLNNEQLEIQSIPFPGYWNQELVTYGILPNSNIGYVYVFSEWPTGPAEQQFKQAITALQNTDGLVIDMRWNEGGWALWHDAFGILCNEVTYTIDDALRCSPTNWLLCPENDTVTYRIAGNPPGIYDRPIAVLLSPACFSMGDVNSYRLRYLQTVRTFGRPTAANLGFNEGITGFSDWTLRYSMGDMYQLRQAGYYLNRKESPIDYPVWLNPIDVANGDDTVVEEALGWMNNLVYGHDVVTDKGYASPGYDTITVSAAIENPNSNNVTAKVFIENMESTFIDSVELTQTESSEIWQGDWVASSYEDFFKLDIKTTDQSTSETFALNNVNRITTTGPIVIETVDISYLPGYDRYQVKPHIKNDGQTLTLENLWISMSSNDTTITSIVGTLYVASIAPGETFIHPGYYNVFVDSNFSGVFSFNFDITRNSWSYWKDSLSQSIVTFTLDVSVFNGWNMVSVPGVNPSGQGVATWWPGLTGSVYKFSNGYQVVTTTTPSEGYWMKHTGAQVYNYPAIEIVPHAPIAASEGWNLIGGYENSVTTSSLTTTPPGLIEGTIYTYGGLGYIPATDIVPGYAYWVKLTGTGNIIIPSGELAMDSGEEYFKEEWGKITILDAAGRSYTLYAVKGEVDLKRYELPPMPPSEVFDIRYESNRIAENLNNSYKTIQMTAIEYPIRVRVENMDIRLQDEKAKRINVNLKSGEDIVISDATITKLMVSGELIPAVFALEQNYPNPFNPSTTIKFAVPIEGNVNLIIYNVLGELVSTIVNEEMKAGYYEYEFNAANIASGVYLYRIKAGDFAETKKMLLLK